MALRFTMRVLPAIVLLSLLGTGAAQAFCFLKNNDRRANYSGYPMPAIGFSPSLLRDYQYRVQPPVRYAGERSLLPQPPLPSDGYYSSTGSILRY